MKREGRYMQLAIRLKGIYLEEEEKEAGNKHQRDT